MARIFKNLGIKMNSIPWALFCPNSKGSRTLGKLILHFNTPEMTERLCQMVPGAIVIDNGSAEHPYRGSNRCIRQENLGFTKGWNCAIKTLWEEFDVFWLMNSDIKISPASVKRVEWIVRAYPNILFFTPAYNCWMKHCQPREGLGLKETSVLEFTAPVINKKVFNKIGFFDELFAKGYGVDFDFCYRARKAGIRMYVDHKSSFYHWGHQTILKHEGIIQYKKEAEREMVSGLSHKYGPDHEALMLSACGVNGAGYSFD